ncbi:MAG: hypothetical protein JOZ54_25455 [Acidobacteria bacterium]|nr:hypothetical protein [Acidobacteriota bacterium]
MRILVALLLAASAFAETHPECASGPRTNEQVAELGAYARAKAAQSKVATALEERNGVFVLEADGGTAPFRRPFDLTGKSLLFARRDARTFAASVEPLTFDPALGDAQLIAPGSATTVVDLGFDFPFRDRTARRIWISGYNAIYFAEPSATVIDQRGDLELATTREAVIAPFLTTPETQGSILAAVRVKQTSESATITWSSAGYTIQATLFRNGDVRFSYPSMASVISGSIVIASGDEPWREAREELLAATDSANDLARSVPAALGAMLDITGVTVSRIDRSDLLEVRITTRGPLALATVPNGDLATVNVTFDNQRVLRFFLDRRSGDAQLYAVPVWGTKEDSPAARIEGSTLVLDVLQDHLAALANPATIGVTTTLNTVGTLDVANVGRLALASPASVVHTDFSTLAGSVDLTGPIEEAFTLPVLNVDEVWRRLRGSYGLRDADIDGVAIYQNFFTDLILYAGAYSTGGNPGVKGIADFSSVGPNVPRSPALMHMNRVGYGVNRDLMAAGHVVMHELGHRWLSYMSIVEDGTRSAVLNPASAHPAQYVDTRAAFQVYAATDSSVMGGGWFDDHGDGTFTSSAYGAYGYSWLDLYLMGLADPSEVTPWFYIADSQPRLGDAYYPPERRTFRGTRHDVKIDQVTVAMGARSPAYPDTQRSFRVAFVLLTDPDRAVTADELALVQRYREVLEAKFPIATGSRANVTTAIDTAPLPPRRRSLR